jgi:hypothetical protein
MDGWYYINGERGVCGGFGRRLVGKLVMGGNLIRLMPRCYAMNDCWRGGLESLVAYADGGTSLSEVADNVSAARTE